MLILIPLGRALYLAQKVANIACGDAEGRGNDQLTPANYAWIGLGTAFWMLVVVGLIEMTVGLPGLE
jgi:hypothetical protein